MKLLKQVRNNLVNLKQMKQVLLFTIAVIMCTGCGGLSKGKAKDEIIKAKNLPQAETVSLPKKFHLEHISGGFGMVCFPSGKDYNQYKTQLADLQTKGYITLQEDASPDQCSDRYMNVILTDKGKKDLSVEEKGSYTIVLCKIEFGEITRITEYKEFNVADVNYTVKRADYSEFGQLVKSIDSNSGNLPETIDHIANFQKSSNGWHL